MLSTLRTRLQNLISARRPCRRNRRERTVAAASSESLESRQLLTFSFGTPTAVDITQNPTGTTFTTEVQLADLDRDGDLDMGVGPGGTGQASIWRNDGNGAYSLATKLETSNSTRFQFADVNFDGVLDVIDMRGNDVQYRVGLGDLRFASGYTTLANVGSTWKVADFDRNGRPDMVYATRKNGREVLAIRWEDATRTMLPILSGVEFTNAKFQVSDLNNDGRPDVVACTRGGQLHTFMQLSARQFAYGGVLGVAESLPKEFAIGDLDADGRPDVVAPTMSQDQVRVWWNDGNGRFSAPTNVYSGGQAPVAVVVCDVDGDGRHDVLTANRGIAGDPRTTLPGDSVGVLLSRGNRTFSPPSVYAAGPVGITGVHPGSITIADVTGDGVPDAVVGHNAGTISSPLSRYVTILPGRRESAGLPDMHAMSLIAPSSVNVSAAGAGVDVTVTLKNAGNATAPGSFAYGVNFFISRDAVLDASDEYLNMQLVPNAIAPGQSGTFNASVRLPGNTHSLWAGHGTYYLLMETDRNNNVVESNESNNSGLGIGIDVAAIRVSLGNVSVPVIVSQATMELWPGQANSRRMISVTDADGDQPQLSAQVMTVNQYLDQKYQFRMLGSYFENWGGLNEKWVWSDATAAWFFVTPQGQLFRQTNSSQTAMTYEHVADVSPSDHSNPANLHDPSGVISLSLQATFSGSTLTVSTNAIHGIVNPSPFAVMITANDGVHSTSTGFIVQRANSMAEQLDRSLNFPHQTNYPTNVLGLGEKFIWSSAGWNYITPDGRLFNYSTRKFVAQLNLQYHVHPQLLHNANMFQIDQQYGLFRDASNYGLNATGRSEKWLGATNGDRYFLLTNGDLYRWNRQTGPASGTLIASLGSSIFNDPRLLHDAQARTLDSLLGLRYEQTIIRLAPNSSARLHLFRDRAGFQYRMEPDGRFIRMSSTGEEQLTAVDRLYHDFPSLLGDALN
jgi:hypothetical protein